MLNATMKAASRPCGQGTIGAFQSQASAPRSVCVRATAKRPAGTADAPLPQLARPKPASAALQEKAQPPPSPVAVTDAYQRAAEAKTKGETVEVKVTGQTERGLVVQFGPVRGFMPYNQLEPARLRASANGDLSALLGQSLKARVVSVEPSRRELVVSERQVAAAESLSRVAVGDVVSGVVTAVEDYGAFVQVKDLAGVSGMVHKSEMSWERLLSVDQAVAIGQEVRAQVLSVDTAACRMALSIKRLSVDPLKVSLDGLAWEDLSSASDVEQDDARADPKLLGLVATLASTDGVEGVSVARVAKDPHHVATELAVYLVRSEGEGSYTAVARLGVAAQQLRIEAPKLSREQMKAVLQAAAAQA